MGTKADGYCFGSVVVGLVLSALVDQVAVCVSICFCAPKLQAAGESPAGLCAGCRSCSFRSGQTLVAHF